MTWLVRMRRKERMRAQGTWNGAWQERAADSDAIHGEFPGQARVGAMTP